MGSNAKFAHPPVSCRIEEFSKNNVTVFSTDKFESLQFARQLASIKNIQADSKPFYVMNVGRINDMLDIWSDYLPRVQPFYAVYCNDDAVLLKVLASNPFVGFQCETKQNAEKILEFVSSDRLLYSNSCWTRSNVVHASKLKINRLSFDNARDLSRLVSNYPNAELILNICINAQSEDAKALLGCDLQEAPELLQMAADLGAQCVGLSFNVGSANTHASIFNCAIEEMVRLFEFAYGIGLSLNVLSIGGGFSNKNNAGFAEICAQINKSLNYYFPVESYPNLKIIATPGRFLAESAFSLVTNVVGRRSVDASYVTNDDFDMGTEAFIYETNEGYYGSFGCRINANCNPQCAPLFDDYVDHFTSEHAYGSVLGPTLDERFDVLQSLCRFRPLRVGEWLMWANMGAYSLNNYDELSDDLSEEKMSLPTIFYFASENDWGRLERCSTNLRRNVEMQNEDKNSFYNNDDNEQTKTIDEEFLLFDELIDEGIFVGGAELERAFSPTESSTSGGELDDEDFLIGLDDFFGDEEHQQQQQGFCAE